MRQLFEAAVSWSYDSPAKGGLHHAHYPGRVANRMDASVPERAEYEQQIEALQDGKRTLYERYLMGEIDLNTYKAEKAACDELLLKTKNAYAAVLAQAKQKQDEQARQDSRKEASKAIFDADTLTTELAELLIDRVLVYPDKRIEIAYKIQDIFD